MPRTLLLLGAVAFLGAGWSAGKAQATVAEFEITVEAPRGDVVLTCSRGCDWNDAMDTGNPARKLQFTCETERCRATFNGHGRITLGMPR